jgi:hypothetical protein
VNYAPGEVAPNYVAVRVPTTRLICVYTSGPSHLIVDLNGTFQASGTTLKAIQPTRLVDTRPTSGALLTQPQFKTRLQPNVPLTVPVGAAVPGGSQGVLVNATVVGPSAPGFLTVYPCGAIPTASNLNFGAGGARPNLVDATVAGGNICVVADKSTDLILDVTGYYS